jgi:hypothetical protein
MPYNAKVFNVMIASPGDVSSERENFRAAIYKWNALHSESKNIVLLPIGWESHSSPEMGERPQGILNKQLLDKSDFLVGVFGARIGTPTGEYPSGTVEEIEKHISANKLVMLYFCEEKVQEHDEEVAEFKEKCKNRGYYQSYSNADDFKEKFYTHLQHKLNDHALFKDISSENISPTKKSLTQSSELSEEASILLKEASHDEHGRITYFQTILGTEINTNGKKVMQTKDNRDIVKWESALNELTEEGLLEEVGNSGNIFKITSPGYEIADKLSYK